MHCPPTQQYDCIDYANYISSCCFWACNSSAGDSFLFSKMVFLLHHPSPPQGHLRHKFISTTISWMYPGDKIVHPTRVFSICHR